MKLGNFLTAVGAVALAAAPVVTQAQSAETARSSEPAAEASAMGGGIGPALIIALVAAIGMGVLFATDNDDDDPVSP